MSSASAFYRWGWGLARAPKKKINRLIFVPTLGLMIFLASNFYFNPAFAKPNWRDAAAYVQTQLQPGDAVIHTSPGSFLPFLVYLPAVDQRLQADPAIASQNSPSQQIIAALSRPTPQAEASRLWLVTALDQSVA